MKTSLILFFIGILLCTFVQADDTITLTKNNMVSINSQVDDASMAQAAYELGMLSTKLPTGAVIYLVLDTPGGSVDAGNRFIDFANSLPQKINPICIYCASMGYHIFQSLGERIVFASSSLMSHRVSVGGVSGQVPGEAITRLQSILENSNVMDLRVSQRIGMNLKDYQSLIVNELWLNGVEAVIKNHADTISKIRCDKDLLSGKKQSTVDTMFGPVTSTISTCPLITGPLSFEFKKESFRSEAEAKELYRKAKHSVVRGF